jgi:chorismate-pyruvate lyase
MDCCKWIVYCRNFFCRNIKIHVMPESTPPASTIGALPYAYPLDEFYARAGLPLPLIERLAGEEIPEPYRTLLVHANDMTPTLESFHGGKIGLNVLQREQRGDYYYRQVVLYLEGGRKPVEFGANKVSLLLYPPKARQMILEESAPLGRVLSECNITHSTQAKAFFKVQADVLIADLLGVKTPHVLYGRRATIFDSQKRPLSEVVEILPPEIS